MVEEVLDWASAPKKCNYNLWHPKRCEEREPILLVVGGI